MVTLACPSPWDVFAEGFALGVAVMTAISVVSLYLEVRRTVKRMRR